MMCQQAQLVFVQTLETIKDRMEVVVIVAVGVVLYSCTVIVLAHLYLMLAVKEGDTRYS